MVKSGKSSEPIAPLRTVVSGPVPRRYKENLEDKIYDRLKAMIVDRALLPGERLQLTKLGTEMRVSRTPLINALKRLAAERLVEWVNRHGFYVRRSQDGRWRTSLRFGSHWRVWRRGWQPSE